MYQQNNGATRVSGHGHFHDPLVKQVGALHNLRELRQWSRQLQAEVYNNPLRNFGKWPMPRRWPTVQQQHAFQQRPVQQQQQVIARRQQAMGRQQPPPKDYTGSRAMQPTTSKCPTRAVAMAVAVQPKPVAAVTAAIQQPAVGIAEQPPSQSCCLPQTRLRRSPCPSRTTPFSSLPLPLHKPPPTNSLPPPSRRPPSPSRRPPPPSCRPPPSSPGFTRWSLPIGHRSSCSRWLPLGSHRSCGRRPLPGC